MGYTKNNERIEAINLYNTGKHTYKKIAEKLNVRANTVGDWINQYKTSVSNFDNEIKFLIVRLNKELETENPSPKSIYCLVNSIKVLNDLTKTP